LLRNHKFDHTMFGFLYRATIGSAIDFWRRKTPFRKLLANCAAAFRLPLVYLGLVEDFWSKFDHYLEIERGLGSTFFVLPFKDSPGTDENGYRPRMRAARYGIDEIKSQLERIRLAGSELGLHGIDAWLDSSKGTEEFKCVSEVARSSEIGVRMHWLFFNQRSPATLEKAGFSYDSSLGYNGTIGYRAGTVQAFKPIGVLKLIELPLHIMDTALFYPQYLNLSAAEADILMRAMVGNAAQFGGVLTINWHDRSIAPERLWDESYMKLIDCLRANGAWFATGAQAVAWFKRRRSAVIESLDSRNGALRVRVSVEPGDDLPSLKLRAHEISDTAWSDARTKPDRAFNDISLSESIDIQLAV